MRKMYNGECRPNVRNFRRFFFGISSAVPTFEVHVFAGDFEFCIGVNMVNEINRPSTYQLKFCSPYCYPSCPLITLQGIN